MADSIVDNSPEMSLDDPRIQALLNPEAAKPAVKPDVKPTEPASSADPTQEEGHVEPEETPETLKKRIAGLTAELARRKGNSERVESLQQEIQSLKAHVEATKDNRDEFKWIQQLDDDALASKQTDWDDELADARARYGRAEEAGDERLMERQGQRILRAKQHLSAFRKEVMARGVRQQKAASDAQAEITSIQSEIAGMHEAISETYPDLLKEGTPLWTAGNEEFLARPALMSRLGPLGEVVAAAMAIIKHPELTGQQGGTAQARKQVIGKLEGAVKRSLSTGASSPTTHPSVELNVDSAEGLANFERLITKIKGG